MTKNKKITQIFLVFIGFFLIIATYFYYPKLNKGVLDKSIVQNEKDKKMESKETNTFDNVEYKGFYNINSPFIILSETAYILKKEPSVVYMTNMKITLNTTDGRMVIITGNKGTYNKTTYDCFLEENVKATDGETTISSENLDLISTKDTISIYNNVNLNNKNGSLKADKVDYDFESRYYQISMFKDEKVKVNLIK